MKHLPALIFLVILYSSLHCYSAKQLPSFIKRCSLADKVKLGQCLVQRVEDLKPRLLKGIPELKLPPIEPLRISKLELHTGNGNTVAFDATVTDIIANGVKDLRVVEMNIDMDSKTIILHTQLPKLNIQGTYSVKGKVLLFEISSTGPLEANITNVDAVSDLPYEIATKNGKRYINMTSGYKLDHKYDKVSIYFYNIFPNNQQLTEEINRAINENLDSLTQEVNPLVFESIHLLIFGIVSPIFEEYSIEELFEQ